MDALKYTHCRTLGSGIPLGGLGTGSVEIRDDGRFHDWEIFNNYQWSGNEADAPPDMWSEDAFFAMRVKPEGEAPRVRLLYDDDKKSKGVCGWYDHAIMYNYPFLRYIERITYRGKHPFARLDYQDADVPVDVTLQAFTPFIPHNAKDSALPLAFFVFDVENTGDAPCETSLLFSLRNCVGHERDEVPLRHTVDGRAEATQITMEAPGIDPSLRTAGSMCVADITPGTDGETGFMRAWTDGRGLEGFPNAHTPAWSQLFYALRDRGMVQDSHEPWERTAEKSEADLAPGALHKARQPGWRWRSAVCRKVRLAPGEKKQIVFMMSWFFPNHYHYSEPDRRMGHMYENWFSSAREVADYGRENFPRLREESRRFVDELYSGSLPTWFADSLNAQLTTFPQGFWWTKDGDMAAWEGMACCQIIPNIHTIWSSWMPLMFFPEQYLDMKKNVAEFAGIGCCEGDDEFLEAEHQRRAGRDQRKQGDLGGWYEQRYKKLGYPQEAFRRHGNRSQRRSTFFVVSGTQLLRDYLWTGDDALIERIWPTVRDGLVRRAEEMAEADGLPNDLVSGMTYDHWFVPARNCYRSTMWLAELRIGAALARIAGDEHTAHTLEAALERGSATMDEVLWNGNYYDLCYDPLKEENDKGCMADQVSGELYVRLCGLEPVHPEEHIAKALRSVFSYCRKPYEGLLNGADPEGREDWRYFARYSERGEDEALAGQWVTPWTGTEYYVAATMLAEGLVHEGMQVAYDVYERLSHAGMLYNHMECGEHYFRPLAAWSMLPALQGLVYDAAEARLELAPQTEEEEDVFDSVYVLPAAWGRLRRRTTDSCQELELSVIGGKLELRTLVLPAPAGAPALMVRVGEDEIEAGLLQDDGRAVVQLAGPAAVEAGAAIRVEFSF